MTLPSLSGPVRPKTKPASRSSASKAPTARPPTYMDICRIAAGTVSNASPQISCCSATHARYSVSDANGRITTAEGHTSAGGAWDADGTGRCVVKTCGMGVEGPSGRTYGLYWYTTMAPCNLLR